MSKAIQNIDLKLSMPYLTGKIFFSSTNVRIQDFEIKKKKEKKCCKKNRKIE